MGRNHCVNRAILQSGSTVALAHELSSQLGIIQTVSVQQRAGGHFSTGTGRAHAHRLAGQVGNAVDIAVRRDKDL